MFKTTDVRAGFTLFEVGISLIIVSFAIVSVMLLFPVGIRTQTLARYQIYASAKALEMVDAYTSFHTCNPAIEMEASKPWEVPSSYCTLAPDLERRLSSYRFGVFPLPVQIASRLDSDNDEIQQVLSDGGYVYYSQPLATTGFKDSAIPETPPNEAQRLVFTVSGYAQQNAIPYLSQKSWPYYDPWPSPPSYYNSHVVIDDAHKQPTTLGKPGVLWEDTNDPDIVQVWFTAAKDVKASNTVAVKQGEKARDYGYRPYFEYMYPDKNALPDYVENAKRYVQAALWYCAKVGVTPSSYDAVVTPAPADPYAIFKLPLASRFKEVQAIRFLSHAATCLTRYTTQGGLNGADGHLDPITINGVASIDYQLSEGAVKGLHESAMNMAMIFAASYPYDWGVPRPLNRPIMMDHPLLEYDLFGDELKGTIGGSAVPATQWKVMSAQPIVNLGRTASFRDKDIDSTMWSSNATSHFNLTAKFDAAERCRQIVFWAVDWQSYEDFETAPSAPVDACKYPKNGDIKFSKADGTGFMDQLGFMDWQQFGFRNPEKVIAFIQPVKDLPTGFNVSSPELRNLSQGLGQSGGGSDFGPSASAKAVFSGVNGADRNFNGKLDRGSVPKSQRLRAVTVARFNYYDLRVNASIR